MRHVGKLPEASGRFLPSIDTGPGEVVPEVSREQVVHDGVQGVVTVAGAVGRVDELGEVVQLKWLMLFRIQLLLWLDDKLTYF